MQTLQADYERLWNLERLMGLKDVEIAFITEDNVLKERTICSLREEIDELKAKLLLFGGEPKKHDEEATFSGEACDHEACFNFNEVGSSEGARDDMSPDDTDSEVTFSHRGEVETKEAGIQCELTADGTTAIDKCSCSFRPSKKTLIITSVIVGLCTCAYAAS